MSGHRCTGTVDTCNICSDRHAHETGPLPSDIEAATRWAERDFERHTTGEDYRDWYGDHSTAPVIDPADEADLIRQLRADAQRILGRTA